MKISTLRIGIVGLVAAMLSFTIPAMAQEISGKWDDSELPDSVRLQALEEHVQKQMETAPRLLAAKRHLALATELGNLHFQGKALMHMGSVYYRKGVYDSVLYCDTSYFKLMQQMGNFKAMAGALNNIGITYKIKGDIPKAIEYYYKSLEMKEQLGDKRGVAKSLNNIALIYRQEKDFDKALILFKKALAINLEFGDSFAIAQAYGHIGTNHFDVGGRNNDTLRIQLAVEYTSKALSIMEELDNHEGQSHYLNNLGTFKLETGEILEAINFFERSLFIKKAIGNKRSIGLTLNNLGEAHLALKQFEKAIEYSKPALEIAQEIERIDDIQRSAFMLYQSYRQLNEFEKALEMHLLSTEMNDSLNREANTKEILRHEYNRKSLTDSLEYSKKEAVQALELEKSELALAKKESALFNQRIILFSSLAGLMLVLALAFSIYKAKKQADQQYREKEVLLQEIHHRVKNNLSVIISLLQLQLRRVQDDAGKKVLNQSIGRIKTMSLIHQNLYQSDNLAQTNFKKYLDELVGQIMSGFEDISEIDYKLAGDEIKLSTDVSIPLALISFEWVNNIYKHAFPDKKGHVEIALKETDKQYEVSISDNGIGISKEEFMAAGKSLGAKIIRSLSNQINAALEIVRQPNGGTRLTLTIAK